ncbi:MAG: hypothetical protein NVSMB16_06630 [Acidimicrobiales bacterium]
MKAGVGKPGASDAAAPALSRPALSRPAPASARARQTQAQLLAAARRVFERDGYLDARVADIAAEAGCSHGSFYTYFRSKTDVFRAVMQGALDNVYASGAVAIEDKTLTQYERIDLANRQFVDVYRENTALMALFEQAATIDPEIRALRLFVRDRAVTRVQKSIERLQREGWARTDIDVRTAAASLVGMVNFTVYFWLVMGETYDEDTLVETLDKLWASSIQRVDLTD